MRTDRRPCTLPWVRAVRRQWTPCGQRAPRGPCPLNRTFPMLSSGAGHVAAASARLAAGAAVDEMNSVMQMSLHPASAAGRAAVKQVFAAMDKDGISGLRPLEEVSAGRLVQPPARRGGSLASCIRPDSGLHSVGR